MSAGVVCADILAGDTAALQSLPLILDLRLACVADLSVEQGSLALPPSKKIQHRCVVLADIAD